jgi:hypothetical protein
MEQERRLRLDFFIAVAALVVSVLTTITLIYQTHVIGQEYASTIWPYLSVAETYTPGGVAITLQNDGLGPALIQSAQLSIDGTKIDGWNPYLAVLLRDPKIHRLMAHATELARQGQNPGIISMSSIGPSTTLRPGDTMTIFHFQIGKSLTTTTALAAHPITLEFCYCSLNQSC